MDRAAHLVDGCRQLFGFRLLLFEILGDSLNIGDVGFSGLQDGVAGIAGASHDGAQLGLTHPQQ